MEKRGKRAQFYLIAAIIIIAAIVTLASVTNKVYVKKEPKKFYDLADILNLESKYVIDNTAYTQGNINANIANYLTLFSEYMEKNTNEDFNLIILYGNTANINSITGKIYSRASIGDVNINIGSSSFEIQGGETISTNSTTIALSQQTSKNITITISSLNNPNINITQTLPIVDQTNFVFVMTTSDGFNQYVQTNLNS
jgi:hypothetical protein